MKRNISLPFESQNMLQCRRLWIYHIILYLTKKKTVLWDAI